MNNCPDRDDPQAMLRDMRRHERDPDLRGGACRETYSAVWRRNSLHSSYVAHRSCRTLSDLRARPCSERAGHPNG